MMNGHDETQEAPDFTQPLRERPALALLRYINPASFGPQHLEQLRRLEDNAWDGTTAASLALRIAQGDIWLWEVGDDDQHAIVLLCLLVRGEEQVLWIEGAAGDGILRQVGTILADLKLIAEFYDCDRIRAASARDEFESLPNKFGFEAVSTIWEMELRHGRTVQSADATDGDAEDGAVGRGEAVL